jgi:molybdopterin-synthase adenylyltransferase
MRYSRQELYKNIGKGQHRLVKSTVCIVGAGALGSVAGELLARAGLNLVIIDRDYVELSNLQRQLFTEEDIGRAKAEAAKEILGKTNSEIDIRAYVLDLYHDNVDRIGRPDVILGCTDNMESKFLINDYALKNKIPYVFGSAVADTGYVFDILPESVCLACIFKGAENDTCDTVGILNSASAAIGAIMANEAIKIILGVPEKSLLRLNIWDNCLEKISVRRKKGCKSCSGKYEYLEGKGIKSIKLCGRGSYQIKGNHNLDELEERLSRQGKVIRHKGVLHFDNITVFEDGRAIIRAEDEAKARIVYSKYIGN